jgi:hypothetical protein
VAECVLLSLFPLIESVGFESKSGQAHQQAGIAGRRSYRESLAGSSSQDGGNPATHFDIHQQVTTGKTLPYSKLVRMKLPKPFLFRQGHDAISALQQFRLSSPFSNQ